MKKIHVFRILVIMFITINFLISYKLENYAAIFIMSFNVLFTLAFVIAESIHAFRDM